MSQDGLLTVADDIVMDWERHFKEEKPSVEASDTTSSVQRGIVNRSPTMAPPTRVMPTAAINRAQSLGGPGRMAASLNSHSDVHVSRGEAAEGTGVEMSEPENPEGQRDVSGGPEVKTVVVRFRGKDVFTQSGRVRWNITLEEAYYATASQNFRTDVAFEATRAEEADVGANDLAFDTKISDLEPAKEGTYEVEVKIVKGLAYVDRPRPERNEERPDVSALGWFLMPVLLWLVVLVWLVYALMHQQVCGEQAMQIVIWVVGIIGFFFVLLTPINFAAAPVWNSCKITCSDWLSFLCRAVCRRCGGTCGCDICTHSRSRVQLFGVRVPRSPLEELAEIRRHRAFQWSFLAALSLMITAIFLLLLRYRTAAESATLDAPYMCTPVEDLCQFKITVIPPKPCESTSLVWKEHAELVPISYTDTIATIQTPRRNATISVGCKRLECAVGCGAPCEGEIALDLNCNCKTSTQTESPEVAGPPSSTPVLFFALSALWILGIWYIIRRCQRQRSTSRRVARQTGHQTGAPAYSLNAAVDSAGPGTSSQQGSPLLAVAPPENPGYGSATV